MEKKKIFLASASELQDDREQFEIYINRKNKELIDKGIFLELVIWEDFLDAISQNRLQNEYNKAIRECDIFVMLFFTKVGKYTKEEFETAFGHFKQTDKPFIFTYFKDAAITTGSINRNDMMSLFEFKKKLDNLGHFYTVYKNIDELKFKFNQQLDKLTGIGFIQFAEGQNIRQPKSRKNTHTTKSISVYCARCGEVPGKQTECPNFTTHDLVSGSGNEYCARCGAVPGKQIKCPNFTTHDFVSGSGNEYCARCGAVPGKQTECPNFTTHDFVSG